MTLDLFRCSWCSYRFAFVLLLSYNYGFFPLFIEQFWLFFCSVVLCSGSYGYAFVRLFSVKLHLCFCSVVRCSATTMLLFRCSVRKLMLCSGFLCAATSMLFSFLKYVATSMLMFCVQLQLCFVQVFSVQLQPLQWGQPNFVVRGIICRNDRLGVWGSLKLVCNFSQTLWRNKIHNFFSRNSKFGILIYYYISGPFWHIWHS